MQASVSSYNIVDVPHYKTYAGIFKLMVSSLTERILKFDIHFTGIAPGSVWCLAATVRFGVGQAVDPSLVLSNGSKINLWEAAATT